MNRKPSATFERDDKSRSRLCIHTITTKPWDIFTALDKYAAAGVGGISIWREAVEGRELAEVRRALDDSGVAPVSYVRGGFYTADSADGRREAIDRNRAIIDEAAELGCPLVVLVCGATPGLTIGANIGQIRDGIGATLDHAAERGVTLAIEPLHPMYADVRSAVATMKTANDLCDALGSPQLGVAVDVFHVWWDPELEREMVRSGTAGRILAFHMCDWKTDMSDMLNDRGLMGEGILDVARLRRMVETNGFRGFLEVEIFSNRWWSADQDTFLAEILKAYETTC